MCLNKELDIMIEIKICLFIIILLLLLLEYVDCCGDDICINVLLLFSSLFKLERLILLLLFLKLLFLIKRLILRLNKIK